MSKSLAVGLLLGLVGTAPLAKALHSASELKGPSGFGFLVCSRDAVAQE